VEDDPGLVGEMIKKAKQQS